MSYLDKEGYEIINKKRVHRLIIEKSIGRKLLKTEVVHHKNNDRSDNRLENLEIMSIKDHNKFHHQVAWNKGKITTNKHICKGCGIEFNTIRMPKRIFCSRSCSARYGCKIAQKKNIKYIGCLVGGCKNRHCSKGFCRKHYYQKRYNEVYSIESYKLPK